GPKRTRVLSSSRDTPFSGDRVKIIYGASRDDCLAWRQGATKFSFGEVGGYPWLGPDGESNTTPSTTGKPAAIHLNVRRFC
ncbi:MAG TPA: hypothetical protein VMS29_01735, partial [Pyrinomonadaceae bacterium]|nr:hypothetical protein [Pyrinomonadaceae bacterium]